MMATNQSPPALPWIATADEITVNFATGSLRESLLAWLKTERGVHVETLLVSIGALAGFAAQQAMWARLSKRDIPMPNAASASPQDLSDYLRDHGLLVTATTKVGETLYMGDLINGYLAPCAASKYPYTLWGFVAASAMNEGLAQSDLPDDSAMFRHVAQTMGGSEFGVPTVEKEHRPQITTRQALDIFWPRTRLIFTRTDGPGPAKGRNVPAEYWPLMCGYVANQLHNQSKGILDPVTGLRLVMESAIAMSKVDYKTVPQTLPVQP